MAGSSHGRQVDGNQDPVRSSPEPLVTSSTHETLRALYQSNPSAVVAIDSDLKIMSLNPAAHRIFGPNAADLVGQAALDLFAHASDFSPHAETGFGIAPGQNENQFQARMRSRSGRVFDAEIVATRMPSAAPELGSDYLLIVRDVSAELNLKAKLEASDIQLRAALASANEGAFSLNLITGLGSTRGFINEFLGIASTDATISLERWLDIADPHTRDDLAAAINKLRDNATAPLDIRYRAQRADGNWRWLHMRGRVTEFTREGTPLRISGVVADVTERQSLEERLAERERQLANAIEAGTSGVWELKPASRRVTPLGEIREILGLPDEPKEISSEVWLERTHPDHRAEVSRQIQAIANGEMESIDVEYPLRDARTDTWIWLRSRGRRTPSHSGETIIAGVLTDVSDRKRLEDAVAQSQDMLREAVESANTGTWNWDVITGRMQITGFVVPLLGVRAPGEKPEAELDFKAWMQHAPAGDQSRVFEGLEILKQATPDSDPDILNFMFGDFPMVAADGSEVWLRSQGRIVEWTAEGHPKRLSGVVSNISEERRLEQALRQSEGRLRDALQASNEGAWRLDLRSRIAEVTAVIAEMVGLPPRDARISYDDWLDRVHPDDLWICTDCYTSLLDGTSDTIDYIVRYRSEAGGWIRIHNRGRISARDEAGAPLVATGFMADISDRLRTEEALQARERQLVEAVEAASIGTWRRNFADDTVSFQGSLVAELFATGTEITLPIDEWRKHVHPDDRKMLEALTSQIVTGGVQTADYEYRLRNHRDEWVWYRNTGSVVEHDANGQPLVSSGVIWNIDAARKAEIEIEERRERFERIYRASPGMMHTIDRDGYLVEVSDYWLACLGYQREEVIGRKSVDFLDEESRRRAVEINLPNLFRTGRNTHLPYRLVRKDGSKFDVLLSSFLERDEAGRPLRSYAVITDVSELREANLNLERTNRELERFATVASHDLQEPLRKIAAFSSLIKRRYADRLDADGVRNLEFLVDAAHRMQRLIDDLLSYSRLASQAIELEPTSLGMALDQALERVEAAIEDSGAVIHRDSLPTVQADPTLLIQILQNLVGNAVKYRGRNRPEIWVTAEPQDEHWRISVRDNGIGLDTRFADKIFAPFQRLHSREDYQGTGIGLAIVRQAVERMDGQVWVDSKPGEGATFSFTLPRTPRTPHQAKPSDPPAAD